MFSILQRAVAEEEHPSASEVQRDYFNISFSIFVLIYPAEILVYIETEILSVSVSM